MIVFMVILTIIVIFVLLDIFISSTNLDITDEYEDNDSVDYDFDDEDYY